MKPWNDEERLRHELYEKEKTQRAVAEEMGCSESLISMKAREFGLRRERPWEDYEFLEELYVEQSLSANEVAERLGCDERTVLRHLHRSDIDVRQPSHGRPPSFGTHHGYERVTTQVDGEHKEVRIHRLVAVSEYGVDAVKDKHVHHKNSIPWDNRPDNLVPLTHEEHNRVHHSHE